MAQSPKPVSCSGSPIPRRFEPEVQRLALAIAEGHTRGASSQVIEKAGIEPFALLDHFDHRQEIVARRQPTNPIQGVLVRPRRLDVSGLRLPESLVGWKRDDGELPQRIAPVVVHHPGQLGDVVGEYQRDTGDGLSANKFQRGIDDVPSLEVDRLELQPVRQPVHPDQTRSVADVAQDEAAVRLDARVRPAALLER